jgi:hypothetical protein
MKNILKIAAGSLTLIHGAIALGEENTPDPSVFSVEPVGVRYLMDGKVFADSEREGESFDFKIGNRWYEAPTGTDLMLFLDPRDEETFVTVDGNGGQLTSLVDSTGKNLLEFPGEPAVVPFKEGGWQAYFREGLDKGPGYGVIQTYMIRANYAPSADADFVVAKGYVNALVSTTKRTEKTSFGKLEKGAVLKSDNLTFKIMSAKVQPEETPAIRMKIDNYKAPGSTVPVVCPLVRYAYESWRLIDGDGQVHELGHRGLGSAGPHGKELRLGETLVTYDKVLTEGSLEVVYWSDLQKVRIPFEVKVYLKKQSEEMRQYNKRIREEYPGFFNR